MKQSTSGLALQLSLSETIASTSDPCTVCVQFQFHAFRLTRGPSRYVAQLDLFGRRQVSLPKREHPRDKAKRSGRKLAFRYCRQFGGQAPNTSEPQTRGRTRIPETHRLLQRFS
jgi:hypothetical protein